MSRGCHKRLQWLMQGVEKKLRAVDVFREARLREEANRLSPGAARETRLRNARQAETAPHIDNWLRSLVRSRRLDGRILRMLTKYPGISFSVVRAENGSCQAASSPLDLRIGSAAATSIHLSNRCRILRDVVSNVRTRNPRWRSVLAHCVCLAGQDQKQRSSAARTHDHRQVSHQIGCRTEQV
jgi:hypothetical protein